MLGEVLLCLLGEMPLVLASEGGGEALRVGGNALWCDGTTTTLASGGDVALVALPAFADTLVDARGCNCVHWNCCALEPELLKVSCLGGSCGDVKPEGHGGDVTPLASGMKI
jgi:hypothetical protein